MLYQCLDNRSFCVHVFYWQITEYNHGQRFPIYKIAKLGSLSKFAWYLKILSWLAKAYDSQAPVRHSQGSFLVVLRSVLWRSQLTGKESPWLEVNSKHSWSSVRRNLLTALAWLLSSRDEDRGPTSYWVAWTRKKLGTSTLSNPLTMQQVSSIPEEIKVWDGSNAFHKVPDEIPKPFL